MILIVTSSFMGVFTLMEVPNMKSLPIATTIAILDQIMDLVDYL